MQKTELKNLHSSMSYFRIQRDKTSIRLHGKGEKSNLKDLMDNLMTSIAVTQKGNEYMTDLIKQ